MNCESTEVQGFRRFQFFDITWTYFDPIQKRGNKNVIYLKSVIHIPQVTNFWTVRP